MNPDEYDLISDSEKDYIDYLTTDKVDDGSQDYQYDEYNYDYYYGYYDDLDNEYPVMSRY